MPIAAIIFDLGDVIIDLDYEATKKAFKKLGATNVDEVYNYRNQSDLFDRFELGQITPEQFRKELKEKLNIQEVSDAEFDAAWNAQLLTIDPFKIEYLKLLLSKYKNVFLFSNTNQIHYDKIIAIYGEQFASGTPKEKVELFKGCFKQQYYSFKFGMKKPSPGAFIKILTEQGLKAEETLFIDDKKMHLEGAANAGLHTMLYTKGLRFDYIPMHIYKLNENEIASQKAQNAQRARL